MTEINILHPFRDGNGRTQRVFFGELARRAKYGLEFSATNPKALLEADIAAYNKDYAPIIAILSKIVTDK